MPPTAMETPLVHRFHPDGSYDMSWGGPGSEPGKFRLVHDVRVDPLGRIWVSDRENCRVQIFTRDGELLAVIGGDLMRIGSVWLDGQYAYIGELDGGVTILDMELQDEGTAGLQRVCHSRPWPDGGQERRSLCLY